MKTIPVYGYHDFIRGHAIVDDEDFEELSKYKWNYTHGYAMFHNGKEPRKWMHKIVNKTPNDKLTDHINRNKLDNRKENLRSVNHVQNSINSNRRFKQNKTGFTGVFLDHNGKNYYAQIRINGKRVYLGIFNTAELANRAYQAAAIKYHGDYLPR